MFCVLRLLPKTRFSKCGRFASGRASVPVPDVECRDNSSVCPLADTLPPAVQRAGDPTPDRPAAGHCATAVVHMWTAAGRPTLAKTLGTAIRCGPRRPRRPRRRFLADSPQSPRKACKIRSCLSTQPQAPETLGLRGQALRPWPPCASHRPQAAERLALGRAAHTWMCRGVRRNLHPTTS